MGDTSAHAAMMLSTLPGPRSGTCPTLTLSPRRAWLSFLVGAQGEIVGKQIDLLQGTLDMLILKAVSLGPLHG
jgi:hypothetical protein